MSHPFLPETRWEPTTLLVSDPASMTVLDAGRSPSEFQEAYDALPPGGYVAGALRFDGPRYARLSVLLALRFRAAALQRTVAATGAVEIRRFGLYPDLAQPTLAYELDVMAEQYVEERLLPRPRSRVLSVLRKSLRAWAGCHPSVAGLLIVGRKP